MNINFNAVLNTLAAKAKALALNVTEIELKVLEATNEEPWGPHGKEMQEIARAAEDPEKYNLIMNVISERLQMRDENWRLCYKGLLLLEYMVKHGPWRIVDELARSVTSLERLRDDFEYKDAQGRDHGINVRQRAGELAALVCNTDRVRQEREKAARNANKFKGVSSSDVRGGFGGFGSNNYTNSGGSGGGGYGYSGFGSGGFGGGSGAGGLRSQGFGSTESVHVPNSLHSRTGSGSNLAAGTGLSGRREEGVGSRTAGGGGEEAEDPFEATRKRIERLKAEGALQEPPAAGAPPGLADPASASAKAPKKLSDVKINPAVAATFASISIPTSNSGSNLVKLAPPPPGKQPVSSQQQQQQNNNNDVGSTSLDLFAEQPSNSQTSHASLLHPGSSATAAGLDPWDAAFGTANPSGGSVPPAIAPGAAGAAAAKDPFAEFTSAAPAAVVVPAAAPSAGFDSLLGCGVSSTGTTSISIIATGGANVAAAAPAAKQQPIQAPLPFDAFSELSDPCSAPAAAPITVGLSVSSATPNVDSFPDPFAALASSSSSASLAPPIGATFRPAPAAGVSAADPFSALSASRATPPAPVMATRPAPAASAPLPFDLFGTAEPQIARTPQPAAAAAPASDPFAALASSSKPATIPMAAAAWPAARPQPVAAAPAAAPFDPFSSAPAAPVLARPAAATPAFDAFGAMAAAPPPAAAPAASSFDDFFGTSAPGQNGQFISAPKLPGMATAAVTLATGDPFTAPSFAAFAQPPPPPPTAAAAPTMAVSHGVAANGGLQMPMKKSGAAHGAVGHKAQDPFAGLGF
ncbi:hypothetical protein Vretimale_15048 [Volvox reticuliferus]|uniref:ENTH domain-containing protein n=1 Tax=Volvox reticuliferus TaxID=1737510 RepID=A0A8J4FXK6_9CHLO|nr:hypothetical protein Vretifemale_16340 [Volvox reticuliferus]GIM11564.1 hypothetical protein Vretimale_15048 [Volvox reticuliferus]